MSIVVTGAAGFIGRHVVDTLRRRGYPIIGVDRRRWAPVDGEVALVADLAGAGRHDDGGAIRDALRVADAVVHLAGRPGVRDRRADADRARWRDNVLAGQVVLAHVPATTPLVVASSSSVYGGTWNGRASHEDDPLRPRGGYARSKVALERACRRRAARGGHVGVVRPFTVAGAGQRPDMAISRWLADARAGNPLTVLGHPHRTRDVTDVRDVAEGIVRMLEREVDVAVNLGTGRSWTLVQLADAVRRAVGAPPTALRAVDAHPDEAADTRADVRRCRTRLGFLPVTDLDDLVTWQARAADPLAALAG